MISEYYIVLLFFFSLVTVTPHRGCEWVALEAKSGAPEGDFRAG